MRQFDEVGDVAGADPVDQVAERAARQQPRRHPHPGPRRVAREEPDDDAEGDQRDHDQQRHAAAGQAEGDAFVVRLGELQRAEHVDLFAEHEVVLDHGLDDLVDDEDDDAEGAGQRPRPGRRAHPTDSADDDALRRCRGR